MVFFERRLCCEKGEVSSEGPAALDLDFAKGDVDYKDQMPNF